MRPVYLAGGAHTPYIGKFHPDFVWKGHPEYGQRENPDTEGYIRRVVPDALAAVGADGTAVDKAYVANFAGGLFDDQAHLGPFLAAADRGLRGKPAMRIEGACASGGLAMAAGIDAIRAGAEVVLVVGAEVQTTRNAKEGADFLARASHYKRQRGVDPFTFPALLARRVKMAVEAGELTMDDLALTSVKAYANANRNPNAHMRAVEMTFERASTPGPDNPVFLSNPELRPWLRVSDCSQVSDGASAIVLASAEGLARLGRSKADALEILACAVSCAPIDEDSSGVDLDNIHAAVTRAYAEADLRPADVQVAEVHDCFTIAEVLMYEAIGLAPKGGGAKLVREGYTQIDGRVPVNTGGGLVGFGHPVGATGVKQALEIWRQCKGLCGDYQMPRTPGIGLSANMGGDDRTAVVTLYRDAG